MNAKLFLQVSNRHGSLERLLRIVRHRGFLVTNLNVDVVPENARFDITLNVPSERQSSLLTKQLLKLVDVRQLDVLEGVSYARSA